MPMHFLDHGFGEHLLKLLAVFWVLQPTCHVLGGCFSATGFGHLLGKKLWVPDQIHGFEKVHRQEVELGGPKGQPCQCFAVLGREPAQQIHKGRNAAADVLFVRRLGFAGVEYLDCVCKLGVGFQPRSKSAQVFVW